MGKWTKQATFLMFQNIKFSIPEDLVFHMFWGLKFLSVHGRYSKLGLLAEGWSQCNQNKSFAVVACTIAGIVCQAWIEVLESNTKKIFINNMIMRNKQIGQNVTLFSLHETKLKICTELIKIKIYITLYSL